MVDLPLSGSKIAHCHMGWDFIQQVEAQRGRRHCMVTWGISGLFLGWSAACCMFSNMKPDVTGVLTVQALLQSNFHPSPAMSRQAKRGFCSIKEPALGKGSSSWSITLQKSIEGRVITQLLPPFCGNMETEVFSDSLRQLLFPPADLLHFSPSKRTKEYDDFMTKNYFQETPILVHTHSDHLEKYNGYIQTFTYNEGPWMFLAKHNLLHQSQGQRAQNMLGAVACHCPYSCRSLPRMKSCKDKSSENKKNCIFSLGLPHCLPGLPRLDSCLDLMEINVFLV